jgi:hypothetical protein
MVTSSSTMTTINLMLLSEKLTRGNHTLWKARMLTVLHEAQLVGFLDGTNKAPVATIKIKTSTEKGTTKDVEEVPNCW